MTTYSGTTSANRARRTSPSYASTGDNLVKKLSKKFAKSSDRVKRNIISFVAIFVALCFIVVGVSCYTNKLQHQNNTLQEQNEYLQAEIDSLDSQIVEQTKVSRVEKVATEKYGMVYPSADNCITIEQKEDSNDSLASVIKDEAYN